MPNHALQGKILMVIFGKIQRFCLDGNPLAGIIPEFIARIFNGAKALFDAENFSILQMCPILAVRAGAFYFFSKQHGNILRSSLPLLYTNWRAIATEILNFSGNYHEKKQQTAAWKQFAGNHRPGKQQAEACLHQFSQKKGFQGKPFCD